MLSAVFIVIASFTLAASDAGGVQREVDFAREIQPVLAKRCFVCHGPDESEGGLRLDQKERALAELDSGERAIVPGDVTASVLLERISTDDHDLRMPPEGKPLSVEEIDSIRHWIATGAKWDSHWAFDELNRPEVPVVEDTQWIRNPIDAFILKRLEDNGLKPSTQADKVALVRRAYYDLTGLPPSPEQTDAFLADYSPNALKNLVNELLDSPRYGEKWGRHWLDLVRFAETNSFERDNPKPHAWRYRDYVIRSFNDDKPYDQFVREQLAGDEFPSPTVDSLIATGYYRLGLWDDEPSDRLQAKYDELDDIVKTTGQVLLGLTIDCARCHDHKIDPISQADYYRLVAFFHNVTPMQTRGDNIERPIFMTPQSKLDYQRRVAEQQQRIDSVQARITRLESKVRDAYRARQSADLRQSDVDDLVYRFYRDTWDRLPDFDNIKPEETGKLASGFFDLSPRTRDESIGFVFDGTLKVPAEGEYTFYLDSDDGSRLLVNGQRIIEHDGIHALGDPKQGRIVLQKGRVPIRLEYFQGVADAALYVAWSGPVVDRRLLSVPQNDERLDLAELISEKGRELLGKEDFQQYNRLRKELRRLEQEPVESDMALCVTERGRAAPETFVLLRGSAHARGDKIEPGFPTVLGTPDPETPPAPDAIHSSGRRTILAHWITSPQNKLTSRVMANRIWQYHFGRGIVRSSNNFGMLGDRPTHPALLDWLAREFVDRGWSIKEMHRLIMNSSTYQMSSRGDPIALSKDPGNDLFWRFDMRRLTAEEIRDSILAVNGKLNLKMFGPGVYPEIPKEVMQGQSRPGYGWGKSSPEDQSRRSVYIHVKRSLLTPILESFDLADPDNSCPVRFATTQPTQALSLLNSEFIQDEARALAGRLRRECPEDTPGQVQRALRLVTGRAPAEDEIQRGLDFISGLKENDDCNQAKALDYYCLMVLNLNEFIYLD